MQVIGLPSHLIRNARAASRLLAAKTHIEADRRRDAVARWRGAMKQGLAAKAAAAAVGEARSTLYLWEKHAEPRSRRPHRTRRPNRPPGLAMAVEKARLDNPMWGKCALGAWLRDNGWNVRDSMVGRIVSDLIARGRVMSVREFMRKCPAKSTSRQRPHAKRKPSDVVFEKPGDVVQIDTMSISRPVGKPIKHFDAYDPFAKWTVARPYRRATARNAADFLEKVLAQMPWPVKAIQIDGGSEFMAEFEQACADRRLPLYVLPPRSPKLNGAVERCNQTWRYEFYGCVDLPEKVDEIAKKVDAFQYRYNHIRPHAALGYKTPAKYLAQCQTTETQESNMS